MMLDYYNMMIDTPNKKKERKRFTSVYQFHDAGTSKFVDELIDLIELSEENSDDRWSDTGSVSMNRSAYKESN